MINSKADYKLFLEKDSLALKIDHSLKGRCLRFFAHKYTWEFQKKLRKLEYYTNCRKDIVGKIYRYFLFYRFRRYSLKLGISIPVNVFGPGLAIVHYGTIIVNPNARVGKNCRLQACTNIGASGGQPEAPQIGDNVYIGPGAKIYGNIIIGNNNAIAANSTVGKSFLQNNVMIAGSPAKVIKEIDISKIISVSLNS